ncbi:MAG: nitroreductase family protein [Candidatus Nanoarchaeia archaeon]|nr:nitroreductase family protein [Candidatus Nanoarchaeia archaeon]
MDIDKCIKDRRSVREYKNKKVSSKDVSKIIESGTYAPCAGNIQNYSFIVVSDDKKKEAIARASDQTWMLDASTFVVVCNNKDKIKKFYEEEGDHYAIQNCAAVTQNMLLTACSLGISSCWVGSYDEIQLRRILKLPDNINVESIVVLGYSDDKPKTPKRLPLNKITYFENFGNSLK